MANTKITLELSIREENELILLLEGELHELEGEVFNWENATQENTGVRTRAIHEALKYYSEKYEIIESLLKKIKEGVE